MARSVHQPKVSVDRRGHLSAWCERNCNPRSMKYDLGVLHGTVSPDYAGVKDVAGVIGYWSGPNARGCAHWVTDNDPTPLYGYAVDEHRTAPHVGSPMNHRSLGIEIISTDKYWNIPGYWIPRRKQLHAVARLMAWVMSLPDNTIQPQVATFTAGGSVIRPGWTTHGILSAAGLSTGHTDPGKLFPLKKVVGWAGWYLENGWIEGDYSQATRP